MAALEQDVPPATDMSATGAQEAQLAANRMAIALLALLGVFISGYLGLYKLGYVPAIACGASGGCEAVQASRWAVFLGIPVPYLGVMGYLAVFATAMAGLQPALAGRRGVAIVLLLLTGGAFAFSAWLTALEAWVIHAWCKWCIANAVVATLMFVAALPELRRLRHPTPS